ncbi:MAG: hypothetical protein ABI992_08225 [Chthoniobacterales bacterium]
MTVIDGTNNSTTTVAVGTSPFPVAVNPITNKIYVPNINSNNVTVITPAPTNAIPLNTAITPAPGNTTSPTATFTLTATSTYAPNVPPPQAIYFQIDTINSTFTQAVEQSRTATTLTASASPPTLQRGLHIIYFFATDGSDATSINPNRPGGENVGKRGWDTSAPKSSPILGGINAYLFLVGPPAVPVAGVASTKTHGSAGAFAINLPVSGNPGIECRSGGPAGNHTLVFTFTNTLASVGSASVSAGTGSVASSGIGADAHQYVVNLTGVANAQVIGVSLSNVTDSAGNSSSAVPVSMGVLLGDTTGNGTVDAPDVGQTKSFSGQALDATNFRADVNVSGVINASDIGLVKSTAGTSLP